MLASIYMVYTKKAIEEVEKKKSTALHMQLCGSTYMPPKYTEIRLKKKGGGGNVFSMIIFPY